MITPGFSLTATERVLPRLALDFTTATLDPRVTFTRAANTATVTNSSGLVATVNANLPRFDYDPITLACKGLLIEEARTNICLNSQNLVGGSWTGSDATIGPDQITSPDGTTNAYKIFETATVAQHRLAQAVTTVNATVYTVSVYLKKGSRDTIRVVLNEPNKLFVADLTAGTITSFTTTTATIQNVGNGWFRCTASFTSTSTTTTISSYPIVGGSSSYLGVVTEGWYQWQTQLEVGAFATSAIVTTTVPVLRNADVATMTGTNFSDWYNATEGTIAGSGTSFGIIAGATFGRLLAISNAAATDTIEFRNWSGSTNNSFIVQISSLQQAQLSFGAAVNNTSYNYIGAYKVNNFAASINAATVLTDAAGNIPTVDRMIIGNLSAQYYNGHIRKISYYPQRLTNAELQAFSK
jgi:hypothetical protein